MTSKYNTHTSHTYIPYDTCSSWSFKRSTREGELANTGMSQKRGRKREREREGEREGENGGDI